MFTLALYISVYRRCSSNHKSSKSPRFRRLHVVPLRRTSLPSVASYIFPTLCIPVCIRRVFPWCLLFQNSSREDAYRYTLYDTKFLSRSALSPQFVASGLVRRTFLSFTSVFSHPSAPKTECKCSSSVFTNPRGVDDIKYEGHIYLRIFLYSVLQPSAFYLFTTKVLSSSMRDDYLSVAFYLVYTNIHEQSHLFRKKEFRDYTILHLFCVQSISMTFWTTTFCSAINLTIYQFI